MILSVSKRTDIPRFYSPWFFNRIKEGFVIIRNPYNYNQVSRIKITPDVVDCIVFWTKDPILMMDKLDLIKDYNYYFQFTITPYDKSIEENLRPKKDIINTFIELSKKIGKEKVIWRYDPILISDKYTLEYHKKLFNRMCELLSPYTDKCIISFLDEYKKVSKNVSASSIRYLTQDEMIVFGREFSEIAKKYNLKIDTCAEEIDLSMYGIGHSSCIDKDKIEEITGYKFDKLKYLNQRSNCMCYESIDIGQYDTCVNNCLYCYATRNYDLALKRFKEHNPDSAILFGEYDEKLVKEKNVKSLKIIQIRLENI